MKSDGILNVKCAVFTFLLPSVLQNSTFKKKYQVLKVQSHKKRAKTSQKLQHCPSFSVNFDIISFPRTKRTK